MMLGTILCLAVLQVLLAAFRPTDAHALNRWGGGYEVQHTMYGYIVYCEEPRDGIADPVFASLAWRRTLYKAYGGDLRTAIRERDNLNLWFWTITENYPTKTWMGKRCVTTTNLKAEEFRKPWYYVGLDGTEIATDATWEMYSRTGTFT